MRLGRVFALEHVFVVSGDVEGHFVGLLVTEWAIVSEGMGRKVSWGEKAGSRWWVWYAAGSGVMRRLRRGVAFYDPERVFILNGILQNYFMELFESWVIDVSR